MLSSPYRKVSILPPAEHPRLMMRSTDLPRIRDSLVNHQNKDAVHMFKELCTFEIRGEGATPEVGSYHLKEYLALEAKALNAMLQDDAVLGRAVIQTLMLLLRGAHFDGSIMCARYSGHLIFVASEVYDWCYKWLENGEKEEIISLCEAFAEKHFEMGYPPQKQAAISGHGNEAQLLRDLLAFSIAVYDERPDIYEFCAGRLFSEYIPAYEVVFAGEFHHQGPCYGSYRYAWALWFGLLILTMSGKRVLPTSMERLPDSLVYLTRSDGEALRLGDDYNEYKAEYTAKNPFGVPLFLASAYTGNAWYHREALAQLHPNYLVPCHYGIDYYDEGAYGEGIISPSVFLIFDGCSETWEPEKLLPARFFGWPIGATVYNDGERLVFMKVGELWGSNHDHLDMGCFQIYDGEILVSDSGVYDSYGTPHRKQYTIQTVAHNCIMVSGQGIPRPCGGKEPKTVEAWTSDYNVAKTLHHSEQPHRYELKCDLSRAYASTCSSVVRSMCWEPERGERGVLTVTDTVVPLEADAPVTFLIHCKSKPEVCGKEIIIRGKRKALVCKVKTPDSVEISCCGGEGHQFESNGVQYEPQIYTSESGWGRVEITAHGSVTIEVEMEIKNIL